MPLAPWFRADILEMDMNLNGTQSTQAIPASVMPDGQPAALPSSRCLPPPNLNFPPYMPSQPQPGTQFGALQNLLAAIQNLMLTLIDMMRRLMQRPTTPTPIPPPSYPETRADLRHFLGMTGEQAEANARRSGISQIRVWSPGVVGTADYVPNRLNLHTDDSGKVVSANWG